MLVPKGQDHLSPSQSKGDLLGLWCGRCREPMGAPTQVSRTRGPAPHPLPTPGVPGHGVGCCQGFGLLTPGPTAPRQQSGAACLGRERSALGAARQAADLAQPQGMSPFHSTAFRRGDATKGLQDGSGGGSAGPGGHAGGANCLCDEPSPPSEPGVSPELKGGQSDQSES